ncbi:peptidoglycan-binding domain-containing protein [Streptomyces jumonjinensis]|uniref:peptidoglycan-binding domain-containing protein n=1 Tax=Streptomyces jumonjinensis TaxID=1945 RepID=UPI00331CC5E0
MPDCRTPRSSRPSRLAAALAAVMALAATTAIAAPAQATAPAPAAVDAAASRAAADTWPVLRAGQKGVTVTALQHLLVFRGQVLTVDGDFGPTTTAKVKAFQQAQGLSADGVVGVDTWSALITTLQSGASGSAVRAAQALLAARGQVQSVNGAFDAAMVNRVRAFQQAVGRTVNGTVDTTTWSALLDGPVRDRISLARQIRDAAAITLATAHSGGVDAASTARQNIVDTADGKGAATSPWSDVPGQRVFLNAQMLNGLLKLTTDHGYTLSISELVGGDHSANSRHYVGVAVDINYINGTHVGSGAPHAAAMAACTKLGATEVLGPGDAGHSTHIHCGWPRP